MTLIELFFFTINCLVRMSVAAYLNANDSNPVLIVVGFLAGGRLSPCVPVF